MCFFIKGFSTVKFLTLKTLSVEISVQTNHFAIAIEQGGGIWNVPFCNVLLKTVKSGFKKGEAVEGKYWSIMFSF